MSNSLPVIAVLAGGTSAEREVSLGSGQASAVALARSFPTRLFRVEADALPAGLDATRQVVFSTLHGTFGEDGGMQRLLDAAGCSTRAVMPPRVRSRWTRVAPRRRWRRAG
jgi:D-alanine-D-alanine ligase